LALPRQVAKPTSKNPAKTKIIQCIGKIILGMRGIKAN
jgi:hypothetical protein